MGTLCHVNVDDVLAAAARSIESLAPAVSGEDRLSAELADIERASARGYFTPDEDERVRFRFAQYLSARAALLQTVEDLKPLARARETSGALGEDERLRAFVLAYTATALLVRAGRFIVERYAPNKIVQRKLNEAEPRFAIPRKQYTAIYRSLTHPMNAWQVYDAIAFADAHRKQIEELSADERLAPIVDILHAAEPWLRLRKRRFLRAYLRYRWHSLRRRPASAVGQAMFSVLELSGRIVAELRNPFFEKRITPQIRQQLADLLQPGDVLLSRHHDAASNLFLPGYWVHASLHIGTPAMRRELGIQIDAERKLRWREPRRVLEAKKDGVRFRALDETLAVDAVAVLRPRLSRCDIARAIEQAVAHEGKLYDFEFDFFRSDRLVCTEVVYRGYHGVGGMEFQLSRRAGRPTLAAEDVLAMALNRRGFEPVAVFGAPAAPDRLITGASCVESLRTSLNCTGQTS